AFGASYRKEEIVQLTFDPTNPTGAFDARPVDLAALRAVPGGASARTTTIQFASVPNIAGDFNVKEAFFELQVPLLADLTGVQQLDTSVAARWADYSGSGEIWAWKVGADWQVYDDLRLRGTISRDIRAATLAERFDRTGGTTSFEDPEFGNAQLDASLATGGNPNVAPEEADTLTFGAVYQPSWLEGFSVSADWYEIDIKGSIGQLGVQRIIDDCFRGAQSLCEQISRDPATNRVTLVENIFLNIDAAKVSGVDMEMSYLRPVNFFGTNNESIRWSFFGTYLEENSITNLGAPKVDRAGEVGGQSLPEFKITTSVNYDVGPFTAFLQLRYTDSGYLDADEEQGVDIDDNTVSSVTYTDFRLSYTRDNANGSSFEVFGHVANLFDEEPPVAASFSTFTGTSSQTNANLYDTLGRRYTAGVRYRY
ncbi:MAG: TonB-dependent receptor, partial [Natronospirillum sp.]